MSANDLSPREGPGQGKLADNIDREGKGWGGREGRVGSSGRRGGVDSKKKIIDVVALFQTGGAGEGGGQAGERGGEDEARQSERTAPKAGRGACAGATERSHGRRGRGAGEAES